MVLEGGTHNSAATHRLDLIDDNIGDPDALFRPCVKSGWDRAQCSRAVQPVLNPVGREGTLQPDALPTALRSHHPTTHGSQPPIDRICDQEGRFVCGQGPPQGQGSSPKRHEVEQHARE